MNKTRKITQGAMMLAILGALILIDRLTAYWFSEFVVLIAPIVIIMYSNMQSFKDGIFLSIGIIIISFLLGNFQPIYLIYIPVGVVTGLVYSYGIKKKLDKGTLAFISCVTYIVGEVIASYIIYPLLGFPVSQMISEMKLALEKGESLFGMNYASAFNMAGLELDKMIVIIYLISTILMGAMEGFLIHILSLFLLKRFKIADLGRVNLWDLKPNKVLAYISFLSLFTFIFRQYITNETLLYILITIAIIGFVVLLYYGYIFISLYAVFVIKKNISVFVVLLALIFPTLLIGLVILGFLYATGPLRTYLEEKVGSIKHE